MVREDIGTPSALAQAFVDQVARDAHALLTLARALAANPATRQLLALAVHKASPAGPDLMTVPEVATMLRCRRQRVDDLLSDGRLPRVKEGRRTLVPRSAVEAHLAGVRWRPDVGRITTVARPR